MKKKKGFSIQINFSNRWLYTFIAIGILMIIGVGVYALAPGIAPNPGHLIDNVAPPADCASDQVLGWDGSAWGCVDLPEILVSTSKAKIIEIGSWNMDTTPSKSIAHGLTHSKIRSITASIRHDNNNDINMLGEGETGGASYVSAKIGAIYDVIQLVRADSGRFDNSGHNSPSLNRGWITIIYEG